MSNSRSSSSRGRNVRDRRFTSKALHLAQAAYLCHGGRLGLDLLKRSLDGDLRSLVETRIDPSDYSDAHEFRDDYLIASLMSKFDSFELGIDRRAEALSRFIAAESQCAEASKRLRVNYVNGLYSRITPESLLLSAREKIANLLGPFSWDLVEPLCKFGPGATVSVPKRQGDAYYKWREKPSVTHSCAVLAYTAINRVPRWFQHVVSLTGLAMEEFMSIPLAERLALMFEFVPGNRVDFVPKDALKDRTIAIEPTMNGFLQHGIGSVLRRRLRRARVGGSDSRRIDLNDQTLNQDLAFIGSSDGSLATLDLSSASDTVSWELVERLFPQDWVEAFALTRSPTGVLPDGSVVRYQKVSSMGNGFTFELESVLFWALSRACVDLLCLSDRRVSVYGDDIIVPSAATATVRWLLTYVGFTVNMEKSHWIGPFRESCGKHYFNGCDVTPIYIRKDVDTVARLFWFANQIRRWSRLTWGLDTEWKPLYDLAVNFLPKSLQQPSIPDGVGDWALIGDLDEVRPRVARSHPRFLGWDGWVFSVQIPIFESRSYSDIPFLLRSLAGAPDFVITDLSVFFGLTDLKRKMGARFSSDRGVSTLKSRWFRATGTVSNWPSYGPWIG